MMTAVYVSAVVCAGHFVPDIAFLDSELLFDFSWKPLFLT